MQLKPVLMHGSRWYE